jgi:outer membrane protein
MLVALFLSAPAVAGNLKIAYVNMERVLNEVEEGKSAKSKLKRDFSGKQKKLDQLQKGLKRKKETFDKQQGMMNQKVRMQKQEELQKEFMRLQQTYMQLQQELMGREAELTQGIAKKIRSIVDKIGDREGYTMVLDIGETVLYYKRHQDITDEVVRDYNKLHRSK